MTPQAQWPIVRLGEVLTPVSRVETVDAAREYPLLGVRLDGRGPFLREIVSGAETAAKHLSRVARGDFIYSRLFSWRGAFGVISEELDGAYVSDEFPTFAASPERLDSEFLRYWFRLPSTLARVTADCTGSTPLTRNRFKEHFFLALEVPLPPLAEQRRIVARIEEVAALIDEACTLRQQAAEEVEALVRAASAGIFGEGVQPDWVPLSAYVARIESGKSPATEGRPAALDEWAVLKVGAVSGGFFDVRQNKALPVSFSPLPELEVRPGDFLMSRANTTALVGACAVVRETRPRLMLSDKTFRFVFRKSAPIELAYLDHAMRSGVLREQITAASSGTSPTMKNISKPKVLSLRLPEHSLPEQRLIVAYLDALQTRVDAVKRLQVETATELDALLPSILDRAFKGGL